MKAVYKARSGSFWIREISMRRKILLTVAAVLPLAGCSTFMNNEMQTTRAAERHPITVDQQTVSLRIAVDPTLHGLSRENMARLDQFMTAYRTKGHGPITVTAPSSGSTIDVEGQQTAANVRAALNQFGLQYEDMLGATYRTTSRERDVIVSFTRYVASGPVCGVFTGEQMARQRNMAAPNFGCTSQANLAAMIADPRDLTEAQTMAPTNGAAVAAAVRSTQTGTVDFETDVGLGASPAGGSE